MGDQNKTTRVRERKRLIMGSGGRRKGSTEGKRRSKGNKGPKIAEGTQGTPKLVTWKFWEKLSKAEMTTGTSCTRFKGP